MHGNYVVHDDTKQSLVHGVFSMNENLFLDRLTDDICLRLCIPFVSPCMPFVRLKAF